MNSIALETCTEPSRMAVNQCAEISLSSYCILLSKSRIYFALFHVRFSQFHKETNNFTDHHPNPIASLETFSTDLAIAVRYILQRELVKIVTCSNDVVSSSRIVITKTRRDIYKDTSSHRRCANHGRQDKVVCAKSCFNVAEANVNHNTRKVLYLIEKRRT